MKRKPIRDDTLFERVSVAEFNLAQQRTDSPIRVRDLNDNGVVDEADDFGGADPGYQLHRMCMERLPHPPVTGDRLGLSWDEGRVGTYFMDVVLDRRAEEIMKRFRRRSPDLFEFGRTPDLGLHFFLGRGDHGRWVDSLRRGAETLDDRHRTAILVEGGFDGENDGCSFNTILKIEGGWGFRRNVLKVSFRNATGEHKEFWNLRTGRIRILR